MMSYFPPLQNDTFLKALKREKTAYTPLWLMRQAGRYLPEYREVRKNAGSFMGLAKNVDFATEVTMQPIDRYGLDAAILFSDILTIPDAMGLGLQFVEGEGPQFDRPLKDEKSILDLSLPPEGSLQYVFDAVTSIRKALNGRVPLIGFSGSPWTLACYMVEGKGSREFHGIKKLMYSRPDLMDRILDLNAQAVAHYLNAQIEAGAQAVMLFDSWGGALADGEYQRFSLRYMAQVVKQLKREHLGEKVPCIVFTKGGALWVEEMANIGADALGLDWTANLGKVRAQVGHKVALQGNLDPAVLFGDKAQIIAQAKRVLDSFGKVNEGVGHVFNLGHGISQFTPPEAVSILVETVHEYSRGLR